MPDRSMTSKLEHCSKHDGNARELAWHKEMCLRDVSLVNHSGSNGKSMSKSSKVVRAEYCIHCCGNGERKCGVRISDKDGMSSGQLIPGRCSAQTSYKDKLFNFTAARRLSTNSTVATSFGGASKCRISSFTWSPLGRSTFLTLPALVGLHMKDNFVS